MNNNIFDLLKILNATNNMHHSENKDNPAFNNYPSDAFAQNRASQPNNNSQSPFSSFTNGENNMLPLLMSMLGKGGDLSKIFSQNNEKKEEVKKESTSPKDEILL